MDPKRRKTLIESAVEAQPYPPEAALAKAWLESNIDHYWDIEAQKRVGRGVELCDHFSPGIRKMAFYATMKRVDLVSYAEDDATLIELKDHVDLAAVRQAQGYRDLWVSSPTDPAVIAVVVVGRTGDADIANTAAAFGVTVELLPQVQV